MSEVEKILWIRNKELMDEIITLNRGLAKVLISSNHDEARTAAKEAFATVALNDPFAPSDDVVQATEEARGAA